MKTWRDRLPAAPVEKLPKPPRYPVSSVVNEDCYKWLSQIAEERDCTLSLVTRSIIEYVHELETALEKLEVKDEDQT